MDATAAALHRELLHRLEAGERVEALVVAQRLLDLFGESDDQQLRSLMARVTVTWLSLKSRLAPDEALVLCEAAFGRFADASEFEAPATAAAALRMTIGLLLMAGRRDDAIAVGDRLARYVDTKRSTVDQLQLVEQLVASAGEFVACEESHVAIRLLRQASADLMARDSQRSRVAAAVAQLWLVVALRYSGEPDDIVAQASTLQEMGEPALQACDQLIRRLSKGAFWRRALMVAISLKIETLEWLGRKDDAVRHQRLFVKVFDGSDLPGVQIVVDEYKAEVLD